MLSVGELRVLARVFELQGLAVYSGYYASHWVLGAIPSSPPKACADRPCGYSLTLNPKP